MFILSGNKKQIINAEFVERFCLVVKPDTVILAASYNDIRPPVTIAKYKDLPEATGALNDLFAAMERDQRCYEVMDSILFYEETTKHDARTKRKGGS